MAESINFLDNDQVDQADADKGYERSVNAKVVSSDSQVDHDLISGKQPDFNESEKSEPKDEKKVEVKKEAAPKKEVKPEVNKEEAKLEKEVEKEKKKLKKLLARVGEEKLELSPETMIKHKVDGNQVEIPLQDLLNGYSGKVSYDKKFQEFDTVRKEQTQTIEKNNNIMSQFSNVLENKGLIDATLFLAEQNPEIDPLTARRNFRQNIITEFQDYLLADEDTRSRMDLEFERSYLLERREAEMQKSKEAQATQERDNQFMQVREQHSISSEMESDLRKDLMTDQLRQAYGIETENDITPQILLDWHNRFSASTRSRDLVNSFNPDNDMGWDEIKYNEIMNEVGNLILSNPKHEDKFISNYLGFRYGKNDEQDAAKKASKTIRETNSVRKKHDSQNDDTPDPEIANWLNRRF